MSSNKVIITGDGSATVKTGSTGITFHSTKGAFQESSHIFIDAGLKYFQTINPNAASVKIFEAGFGTGLNALLTAIEAPKLKLNVQYHSIDKFPLHNDVFLKLNYAALLNEFDLYKTITQTPWNQLVYVTPFFNLKKIKADLQSYCFDESFDIIYFDAFAPNDQPELWTENIFKAIYRAVCVPGILVTYCSKSMVRRNLQAAGFVVEKLPGPPGKREIVRALKIK